MHRLLLTATETAQQLKRSAGVPFHAKGRGLLRKMDTTSKAVHPSPEWPPGCMCKPRTTPGTAGLLGYWASMWPRAAYTCPQGGSDLKKMGDFSSWAEALRGQALACGAAGEQGEVRVGRRAGPGGLATPQGLREAQWHLSTQQ